MTFSIVMTGQQLSSEFDREEIKVSASHMTYLGIEKNSDGSADNAIWPDAAQAGAVLEMIAGRPLVQAVTFTVDAIERHSIFRGGNGQISLLTAIGDEVSLIHDISNDQLVSIFVELLSPTRAAPPPGFLVSLGFNGMAALHAALDHIRLLVFASLMERTGLQSVGFQVENLQEQIATGKKGTDFRWLCAALHSATEWQVPFSKKALVDGCSELEETGLLTSVSNGKAAIYQPSPALIDAALDLLNPQPIMVLQGTASSSAIEPVTMLLSGRSFWSMQCRDDQFTFGSIDGLDVIGAINQALRISDVPDEAPEAPAPAHVAKIPKFCPECGAANTKLTRFCTSCGSSVLLT